MERWWRDGWTITREITWAPTDHLALMGDPGHREHHQADEEHHRRPRRLTDSLRLSSRSIGTTGGTQLDDRGCGWAKLELTLKVGDRVATGCEARIALPVDANDNPWLRKGADWKP